MSPREEAGSGRAESELSARGVHAQRDRSLRLFVSSKVREKQSPTGLLYPLHDIISYAEWRIVLILIGRREPENRAGRRTVSGATAAGALRTKLALSCTMYHPY